MNAIKKITNMILASVLLLAALSGYGKSEASELPPASKSENGLAEFTGLTDFTSDFGYTISYDEDSFDYRRTEGYDEFVLKSDAVDKPFVFICVSSVGAEFVDDVKEIALGDSPEDCLIGQAKITGQCAQFENDWDGGKVIRKTYFCPLETGDALLIETQWYTEQTDDPYAALLWEMVSSIKVSERASDGTSADVNEHQRA